MRFLAHVIEIAWQWLLSCFQIIVKIVCSNLGISQKKGKEIQMPQRFAPRKVRQKLPGTLWCVTAYFNPMQYMSKLLNFIEFRDKLISQGANLFVVECALPDQPFVMHRLMPLANILQVRSKDVIWQKECLLNLGIKALPKNCDKVAWLDCDIYFDNDNWVEDACEMLEDYKIVQPFRRRFLQNKDGGIYEGEGKYLAGWISRIEGSGNYEGGHPGYAWCARRDLMLKHPMYERCASGVGDFLFACAVVRMHNNLIGDSFHEWANKFIADVEDSVYYLPQNIHHMYHGPYEKRNYFETVIALGKSNFNPDKDIKKNKDGALEWANDKIDIHEICRQQLATRDEDN